MGVLPAQMATLCACLATRAPGKDIRSPGTRVAEDCEPPCNAGN